MIPELAILETVAEDLKSGLPRVNPAIAVRVGLQLATSGLQVQYSKRPTTHCHLKGNNVSRVHVYVTGQIKI